MGRNLEDFIKTTFKKAIDNREIQVFYQPVIRVLSRKLCSFEALARWIDPEIGMVYPDEFIPVLEKAVLNRVPKGTEEANKKALQAGKNLILNH